MSLRTQDPPSPEGEFPEFPERLVVSPGWGHVHRRRIRTGRLLDRGTVIGEIRAGRVITPVRSTSRGAFVAWLVAEGDLVEGGQALARLQP